MLVDVGLPWVVLGHSERRHVIGETDEVRGPLLLNLTVLFLCCFRCRQAELKLSSLCCWRPA